jgi:L-threonylcarbamoyladenylate synthase
MEKITNPMQHEIKKAAKALKDGHLVAFPTETVYGLGADATNEKAIGRIYSVKGRPTNHPLIVHIASISKLDMWAIDIPEYALKLAKEFWPGPMTLILTRSQLAGDFITGGQNSVGLRVPSNLIALLMLKEFEKLGGTGIAAPSANKFGSVSPTSSEAVYEEIGGRLSDQDSIINGGHCEIGIESTIIDCTHEEATILRPGYVTEEMILEKIKLDIAPTPWSQKTRTSGQLKSHYSPKAEVILGGSSEPGEGLIAMANVKTPTGTVRLAAPETELEFAQNIYSALRLGDKIELQKIRVLVPKGTGLTVALEDRLQKAAFRNT